MCGISDPRTSSSAINHQVWRIRNHYSPCGKALGFNGHLWEGLRLRQRYALVDCFPSAMRPERVMKLHQGARKQPFRTSEKGCEWARR